MKYKIFVVLLILFMTFSHVVIASAALVNGSFEDPVIGHTWITPNSILGWSATNMIEVRNNVAGTAYDGNNFVELDVFVNSSMSQTVTTTPGAQYALSYYYAPRAGVLGNSNGIELWFNSTQIDSVTGNGNQSTAWILRSLTVTGTGSDTITFKAVGVSDGYGGSLDKVSMAPVPLPGALWLLGPGLAGLAGIRRRFAK